MAKFENIVRPAVFPNIRPPGRVRSVGEEQDEDEGAHVIRGGSGGFVDLPYSWSVNTSRSRHKEVKRRVDVVRVYQKEKDGTVNKENFIDVEVTNKLWMEEEGRAGAINEASGAGTPGGGSGSMRITHLYGRVQEDDNVEYIKQMIVKENPKFK